MPHILYQETKTDNRSNFMKSIGLGLSQLLLKKQARSPAPNLGERELELLKILWEHQPLSAREVLEFSEEATLSLSTVQSTLERLYRKELLHRNKQGRQYLYRAAVSRSTIIGQLLGDIADQFSEGDIEPMISGFVSYLDQQGQDNNLASKTLIKQLQGSDADSESDSKVSPAMGTVKGTEK